MDKRSQAPLVGGLLRSYGRDVKLHGSLKDNLAAAVRSARRLRGRAVHADTLRFWSDLLDHARDGDAGGPAPRTFSVEQVIVELETELAQRDA
jgi:hypothetical protein